MIGGERIRGSKLEDNNKSNSIVGFIKWSFQIGRLKLWIFIDFLIGNKWDHRMDRCIWMDSNIDRMNL